MHGMEDSLIPYSHSQELYDAAKEPRSLWLVEGAVHTGLHNKSPREWENRFVGYSLVANKKLNFPQRVLAFIHDAFMDWTIKN